MRLRGLTTLLLLLLLTGCTRVRVKVGSRVYLATLPVSTMAVSLPAGPGIAPGERLRLVATFVEPDGTVLTTEGLGKGKVLWQDVAVQASVVTVKSGVVALAQDPRLSEGKVGHLELSVPTHLGLHAALDIPVRYDYGYQVSVSGSKGLDGTNGNDGSDGAAGSTGSFDPDHPVAGGNGGNGTSGTSGTDGSNGSDGPSLRVRMLLRAGSPALLEMGVSSDGGTEAFYLVDPNGGSLTLRSEGGSGGSGGKGGRAGRGGQGGAGSPSGTAGSDGQAGQNGSDGHSGSDGSVRIVYDPSAQPYLATVRVASGRASYEQAAVGPIW